MHGFRELFRDDERALLTGCAASEPPEDAQRSGERDDLAPRFVSIGPVTSSAVRESGFTVDAEAEEHTIGGLVRALEGLFRSEDQ